MTLMIEANNSDESWVQKISDAVRDVTKLRAQVQIVKVGSLPNDGKVIEDARTYK
jgi:phenylacetate-CoA ligase